MSSCHVTTTFDMDIIESSLLTYNLNESVSVLSFASVTVTVTVDVPVPLGVPLMTPVDVLNEMPAGLPDTENVYGSLPPETDGVIEEIALLTSASTSGMSASSSNGGSTTLLNVAVPQQPPASVAFTVTRYVRVSPPTLPLTTPVEGSISTDPGAPDIVNVYGDRPPDAVAVIDGISEFFVTSSSDSPLTVIVGQDTVIFNVHVSSQSLSSVTVTVTVYVPGVDGAVPVMVPLDEMDRSSPDDWEIDHVYGVVPPDTVGVTEMDAPGFTVWFEGHVSSGSSKTVIFNVHVSSQSLSSVTVTVTVYVPGVDGAVPVMVPLDEMDRSSPTTGRLTTYTA